MEAVPSSMQLLKPSLMSDFLTWAFWETLSESFRSLPRLASTACVQEIALAPSADLQVELLAVVLLGPLRPGRLRPFRTKAAFLAPEVPAAALDGKTQIRLKQIPKSLPLSWREQHRSMNVSWIIGMLWTALANYSSNNSRKSLIRSNGFALRLPI